MGPGAYVFSACLAVGAGVIVYLLGRSIKHMRHPETHASPVYTRAMGIRRSAGLVLLLVACGVMLLWVVRYSGADAAGRGYAPLVFSAVLLGIVTLLMALAMWDFRDVHAGYRRLRKKFSEDYRDGTRRAFDREQPPRAETDEDSR